MFSAALHFKQYHFLGGGGWGWGFQNIQIRLKQTRRSTYLLLSRLNAFITVISNYFSSFAAEIVIL